MKYYSKICFIVILFVAYGNMYAQDPAKEVFTPNKKYKAKVVMHADNGGAEFPTVMVVETRINIETILNPKGYNLPLNSSYFPHVWLNNQFLFFVQKDDGNIVDFFIYDRYENIASKTDFKLGQKLYKLSLSTKKNLLCVKKDNTIVNLKVLKEQKPVEKTTNEETTKNKENVEAQKTEADKESTQVDNIQNNQAPIDAEVKDETNPESDFDNSSDNEYVDEEEFSENVNDEYSDDFSDEEESEKLYFPLVNVDFPEDEITINLKEGDKVLQIRGKTDDSNYAYLHRYFDANNQDITNNYIGKEFHVKYELVDDKIELSAFEAKDEVSFMPEEWKMLIKEENEWKLPEEIDQQAIHMKQEGGKWFIENHIGIGGVERYEFKSLKKMNDGESVIIQAVKLKDRGKDEPCKIYVKYINYNQERRVWIAQWAFPNREMRFYAPGFTKWFDTYGGY